MYRVISCNFCGDYRTTKENLKECLECGSLNVTRNWHSKLDEVLDRTSKNSKKAQKLIQQYQKYRNGYIPRGR